MSLWIDPAVWPAHGRLWAHLASDVSYDDLHAFAAAQGLPRRAFDRDHYDVPADAIARLIAAGASPVSARELVTRLNKAGLRKRKAQTMGRRALGSGLLRPPGLRAGDLVAVTATAGPIVPERLEAGVDRLRGWGLRVTVTPHTLDRGGPGSLTYLAGTDADRAGDFTTAWLDDDVKAIVVGRGGYGTQRMLDLLDWRRLAEAQPKILVGFSDVTALHQAVASQLGVVTVHGHVATSLGSATDESAEMLRAMLFEPEALDLFADSPVRPVVPGTASGVLVGGNLALVAAELGSPFSRPAKGGIVLLEELGEDPYRIDRLLTQLIRAGWFDGVRGIVLATFTDCGEPAECESVLLDRLLPLAVPTVLGFDAGHTPSMRCVPLGLRATLHVPAADEPASLRLAQPPFT
jgi:muramoyltetrapeptide carboxypeptidase